MGWGWELDVLKLMFPQDQGKTCSVRLWLMANPENPKIFTAYSNYL